MNLSSTYPHILSVRFLVFLDTSRNSHTTRPPQISTSTSISATTSTTTSHGTYLQLHLHLHEISMLPGRLASGCRPWRYFRDPGVAWEIIRPGRHVEFPGLPGRLASGCRLWRSFRAPERSCSFLCSWDAWPQDVGSGGLSCPQRACSSSEIGGP